MIDLQSRGDLLWRVPLQKPSLNRRQQPRVPGQLVRLRTPSQPVRPALRRPRPIPPTMLTATDLPPDRRAMPTQPPGDLTIRLAPRDPHPNLNPVLKREPEPRIADPPPRPQIPPHPPDRL